MSRSYKRPCNYSIWFATRTLAVRENLLGLTFWINGPKIKGEWNYDLNNSYQRFVGHIFRGAYRYHNKNIGGLASPIIPFMRQLYIAKNSTKSWSGINYILFPVIRIARYDDSAPVGVNTEYDSDEIFSTTCHETAHSSHALRLIVSPIQFWQVSAQLRESWAVAIEWFLSHIEYAERGISNYGEWDYHPPVPLDFPNDQAYQFWRLGLSSDYTSLFINLIDRENDNTIWFFSGTPNDQVSGYSLPFIEQNILKYSYNLSTLGNKLKNNKPVGVTDAQIDLLLNFY